MRIFNLTVYREENLIKFALESLLVIPTSVEIDGERDDHFGRGVTTIYLTSENTPHSHIGLFDIIKTFEEQNRGLGSRTVSYTDLAGQRLRWASSYSICVVTRKSDVDVMIKFLSALAITVSFNQFDHVTIQPVILFDQLQASTTLNDFLDLYRPVTDSRNFLIQAIQLILRCQDTPLTTEDAAICSTAMVEQYYQSYPNDFADFPLTVFPVMISENFQRHHVSFAIDRFSKPYICSLLSLQIRYLQSNLKNDLTEIQNRTYLNLKHVLFELACGRRPIADVPYNMYPHKYTTFSQVWELLSYFVFKLGSDGRLFIELAGNPGYEKWYAPGKPFHATMEAELLHLGRIIGLQFSEDTQFHRLLIMSPECSMQLMKMGLHHSPHYLKDLLKLKTLTELFKRSRLHRSHNDSFNPLFHFPRELIDKILEFSSASNLYTSDVHIVKEMVWSRPVTSGLLLFKPQPNNQQGDVGNVQMYKTLLPH